MIYVGDLGGSVSNVPDPTDRPRPHAAYLELRRQILAGRIPPGSLLPTEASLQREYSLSRGAVRDALERLRAEGLIHTEHGRGSYARPVMPVRRLGPDRYQPTAKPATPFTVDQQIEMDSYQLDTEFREVPATAALGGLFGVERGTMLLERGFVFRASGVPQQLSTSYLLLDMVAGTPVADPANEPWSGGTLAQLRSLGIEVTDVREVVRSRMPMPDETRTLQIAPGVPVLTVTRRMLAGERVVEVAADIVIPADRCEVEYHIGVTPQPDHPKRKQ